MLTFEQPLLQIVQTADAVDLPSGRREFEEAGLLDDVLLFAENFVQNFVFVAFFVFACALEDVCYFVLRQALKGKRDFTDGVFRNVERIIFRGGLLDDIDDFIFVRRGDFQKMDFLLNGLRDNIFRADQEDGTVAFRAAVVVGFANGAERLVVVEERRKVAHHDDAVDILGDDGLNGFDGILRGGVFTIQPADAGPCDDGGAIRRGDFADAAQDSLLLWGEDIDNRRTACDGVLQHVDHF